MKIFQLNILPKILISTFSVILVFGFVAVYGTYTLVLTELTTNQQQAYGGISENNAAAVNREIVSADTLVKKISEDLEIGAQLSLLANKKKTTFNLNSYLNVYNAAPLFSAVYLINHQGITIASTDSNFLGQDYSFREYFRRSIAGQSYTEVNLGVTSGRIGYYLSEPIIEPSGEILGVAVVKIEPRSLQPIYDHLIDTGAVDIMLVDRFGVIIESNRPERILKSLGPLDFPTKKMLADNRNYLDVPIRPLQYLDVHKAVVQKPQKTVTVSIFDYIDGHDEIFYITPIFRSDLYVVSEVGMENLVGSARKTAIFISVIVGINIVVVLLLLSWLIKFSLAPLGRLTQAATLISRGDFSIDPPVDSHDEFGSLGRVIFDMAHSIKNKYQELESLVRQRTRTLESQTEQLSRSQVAIQNLLEDTREAQKNAEKAAADLEKFQKAVEGVSDHIVITDPEGLILYANPAVTRLTGFPVKEVIGKKAGSRELWGGLMPKEFYKHLWQTIKVDKKMFVGEINNRRKNGQKYIALSSISPIMDSRGKVLFYVGIERDATVEREIDRMKTEFVSFASHQLRTPLTAMKWFLEMLLGGEAGKLNREQQEFIKNVYDSNERMVELVKDLLDISRIESGRIIIDPVPTNVVDLVKGVITEVELKAKTKKQKISANFDKSLPLVNLDPSLVRNVYLNLLTNAIKYTPEKGKISLKISLHDDTVLSEISDNGLGIPHDQQDQTFQKFFRATNAVKKETEGTGLGLYLVKSVVESSGGKIWFRSSEGKGTTFWFSLPIAGVPKKEGQIRLGS